MLADWAHNMNLAQIFLISLFLVSSVAKQKHLLQWTVLASITPFLPACGSVVLSFFPP